MKCAACGEDFRRALLLAMLIECGAQTTDPNYCADTEDHEHQWEDDRDRAQQREQENRLAMELDERRVKP